LFLLDNDAVRSEFSRHAREDILREASIEGMFATFCRAVEFVQQRGRPAAENHPVKLPTA
jgi:hypothetical protein